MGRKCSWNAVVVMGAVLVACLPNAGCRSCGPTQYVGHAPYGGNGCGGCGPMPMAEDPCPIPKELKKVSLPEYIIEPPDILVIDLVRGTPRGPYVIEPYDVLQVQVADALPNEPIAGLFTVQTDGSVNFGLSYGALRVGGLTIDQARIAIRNHLRRVLKDPQPLVAVAQPRGLQQLIRGEHLVRQDGTIGLGSYGSLYVAGLNLSQAKAAIEQWLCQCLERPKISLDVSGFNSKVYYVFFDGGGYGQTAYRLPITGNETVIDAITSLNGLPPIASKKKIWVARPAPVELGCDQVLPVDWNAIVQGGSTATNYQILPGDRIYVKADCLIATDNWIAKVLAPLERLMGFALLTGSTINQFSGGGGGNGGGVFVGAGN